MKHRVNCWNPLRAIDTTAKLVMTSATVLKNAMDWEISSQATKGYSLVEGSTARSMSPNNNSTHECATSEDWFFICQDDDIA